MAKSIPTKIAKQLLAGEPVSRGALTDTLETNAGIAKAVQTFALHRGLVVERSCFRNRTSYVCRASVNGEVAGTLIEVGDGGGHIVHAPGQRIERCFAATNGRITIWRCVRGGRKVFRSAIIKGFSRQWRSARPSGSDSFPTVQISPAMVGELLAAKSRHCTEDDDPWVENSMLPESVRTALDLRPVDNLADVIEKEAAL